MKRQLKIAISGIASGILISIGGIIFLSLKATNPIVGSLLFAFGLSTIILLSLYLYTGKIGYVFDNKKGYLLDLASCLVGNLIGAVGTGYLLRLILLTDDTRFNNLFETGKTVSETKLNSSWLTVLIMAIFCGIMIYLAVEISKRDVHPVFKLVSVFVAISVFILAGFEHCIADMFYFSIGNAWNLKAILYILLIIFGNSLGSIVFSFLVKGSKL